MLVIDAVHRLLSLGRTVGCLPRLEVCMVSSCTKKANVQGGDI